MVTGIEVMMGSVNEVVIGAVIGGVFRVEVAKGSVIGSVVIGSETGE